MTQHPRTTRRGFLALGAAAGLYALPALAQGAPAQPPPAPAPQPPAAPGEQPVTLVYKYAPGRIQYFRANAKMEMALSFGAAGTGMGPIPMNMDMGFVYSEKVAGVKDGTGTLAVKSDAMTMKTEAMGQTSLVKVANGKTTMTVNGQALRPEQLGGRAAALQRLGGSGPSGVVRRDARGTTTIVSGGATGPGQFLGNPGAVMLELPDHPVRIGDVWDVFQKVKPQVPGGGQGAPAGAETEVKLTNTLKSVTIKNGRRLAVIETFGAPVAPPTPAGGEGAPGGNPAPGTQPPGTPAAPGAPGPSVTGGLQSLSGNTIFDIDRGVAVAGDYNASFSMSLDGLLPAMPGAGGAPGAAPGGAPGQGAPGAPAMPSGLKMEGQVTVKVLETAPPAPAKRPVKPAARKGKRR